MNFYSLQFVNLVIIIHNKFKMSPDKSKLSHLRKIEKMIVLINKLILLKN